MPVCVWHASCCFHSCPSVLFLYAFSLHLPQQQFCHSCICFCIFCNSFPSQLFLQKNLDHETLPNARHMQLIIYLVVIFFASIFSSLLYWITLHSCHQQQSAVQSLLHQQFTSISKRQWKALHKCVARSTSNELAAGILG